MATSSTGTSNVSSTFSEVTKLRVKELSENSCWICGAPYPETAHMIAREDRQASLWLERGLINFSLTSISNAIALCDLCHNMFDCALDPGVSLIPTDLRYFLDFEKKDRERRRIERRNGNITTREVPTADMYKAYQMLYGDLSQSAVGGLYQPIFLQRYLAPRASVDVTEDLRAPHEWHGAPLAALRRCFPLLGSGRINALSREQRLQLQELRDLYFLDEDAAENTEPISGKHPRSISLHSDQGNDSERPPKRQQPSQSHQPQSIEEGQSSSWVLGPDVSVKEIMARFAPLIQEPDETDSFAP